MISDQIEADIWSAWLLRDRHGDDTAYGGAMQSVVARYADRVLNGAMLAPGMRLLDVGAGDGLIAFRAIERVGPDLQVVLSDVSAPLLAHAEALARRRGLERQCTFLQGSADDLRAVPDASVDVVTTRAVLAYVADKPAALGEFHRVLKPGGRISIAEPIFQDDALVACALRRLVDGMQAESPDRFLPLLHRWKAALFPDTEERMAGDPLCNYSERDLLGFVQAAGFARLHMEFHVDVEPVIVPSWEAFLGSALHPLAPTHGAILAMQFNAEERRFFEQIVRPSIETGQFQGTDRIAYLTAIKTVG